MTGTSLTNDGNIVSLHASSLLKWPESISNLAAKREVAEQVASYLVDGTVVGIGSGSTAYLSLFAIAHRVKRESMSVRIVPSSHEVHFAAARLGLDISRLLLGLLTARTRLTPRAGC